MLPTIKGLHLELTNICMLKCPGCARTKFIEKWAQHWKNHNINRTDLMSFIDVSIKDIHITLAGNYGDPAYHPECIEIIQDLKERGATVTLVTNGSYKKESWWHALMNVLTEQDTVVFSIDGTPENFTQYRINADWSSIEQGIKIVASYKKVNLHWKHIVFAFNENTVDAAKQLSVNLGFDDFEIRCSDRFDEYTEHFMPGKEHIGARFEQQIQWKNNIKSSSLDPLCTNNKEHYISADGYYTPCCYSAVHTFYYKTVFGKEKSRFSIRNNKLSSILSSTEYEAFNNNLPNQTVCQYNCSGDINEKQNNTN